MKASLMNPKEQEVICTSCLKSIRVTPKITLAGFQKFFCPHCKKYFLYPITRKTIYWIIPIIVGALFFFALLSLSETDWGDRFLSWMSVLTIHIDEKKGLILWPLLLWSLVRLGGMYSKKVLEISRKILYGTGLLALVAVLLAFLGLLAGVMRIGYVVPPLIGAVILLAFFVINLRKDALLRKKTETIRPH
jgi:hypothetical protein